MLRRKFFWSFAFLVSVSCFVPTGSGSGSSAGGPIAYGGAPSYGSASSPGYGRQPGGQSGGGGGGSASVPPHAEGCMSCLCQASTGCDVNKECVGDVCGPFAISWQYWKDAGQPGGDYVSCANDVSCAVSCVRNYVSKYAQDCDGNGVVDCADAARIHHLGRFGCSGDVGGQFGSRFSGCDAATAPGISALIAQSGGKRPSNTSPNYGAGAGHQPGQPAGSGPSYQPRQPGSGPSYQPGPQGSGPSNQPGQPGSGPSYQPGPGPSNQPGQPGSGPSYQPGQPGSGPSNQPGQPGSGPSYQPGPGPSNQPGQPGSGPSYQPGQPGPGPSNQPGQPGPGPSHQPGQPGPGHGNQPGRPGYGGPGGHGPGGPGYAGPGYPGGGAGSGYNTGGGNPSGSGYGGAGRGSASSSGGSLSNSCLGCICNAASGCSQSAGCNHAGCGPMRISRAYWIDAGSPGGDFDSCANSLQCSMGSARSYLSKYAKDCDGDGAVTCQDFARIHRLGPYGCGGGLDREFQHC